MNSFDHFTPATLAEALALLGRLNGQVRVIAGGTDLLLKMKAGLVTPPAVINIKRLPELKGIYYDNQSGLRLGALTTLRDLCRSSIIQEHYPSLAQAAGLMASEQIRSFATLGGNLCNASPSADLAPPLIALDATACLAGPGNDGAGGQRRLSLEAFFLGPGRSALGAGELLKVIHVPPPAGKTLYLKQAPRAYMDIAVAGVAVRIEQARLEPANGAQTDGRCEQARIVLGAVAPVPLRAFRAETELVGRPLTAERIERAAAVAAEECTPIDDVRSSAWYRRRTVQVLTRRALQQLSYGGPS
jgi:carbon-monoxide dehydrogenase medium subunit